MDDRIFDGFVRLMASRPTRRGIARGAALVAAAAFGLARSDASEARHALIALGGACRHTRQCLHHALASRRVRPSREAVSCADNGFRYDGQFNCCRHGGGSCTRDEDCCGTRHFCRSRVCTYLR
ncbi:MAG: hypothetical protein K0S78_4328 [Thermomicrobiales bacterium]|nr:hypothetical protein [Thermomicrobiales bacterium]MDF3039072.1 hypothetical protein [Thermomicrobiales bacterium]